MAVLPADVIFNGDLCRIAQLAFRDLGARIFAFFDLTTGAVVRTHLYSIVSMILIGVRGGFIMRLIAHWL